MLNPGLKRLFANGKPIRRFEDFAHLEIPAASWMVYLMRVWIRLEPRSSVCLVGSARLG
jgi:hypothetical protein